MPRFATPARWAGTAGLTLAVALGGVGAAQASAVTAAQSPVPAAGAADVVVTRAANAPVTRPATLLSSASSQISGRPAAAAYPILYSAAAAPTAGSGSAALPARHRRFGLPQASKSGRAWLSGAWLGGQFNAGALRSFGGWRGSAVETVTTYSEKSSFAAIRDEDWSIYTFKGFPGTLTYGLSILPDNGQGSLATIAAGRHDDVWRGVARNLVKHGRGRSIVRIGLEANGTWFRWGATARTASTFRAAFRRVAKVMKSQAPGLIIDFNIGCGVKLQGSTNRLAPLTMLYPGDDVVNIIGCDHYDSWSTRANSAKSWAAAIRPRAGAGLADVAAFARAHRKGFSVPEWGLTKKAAAGLGDNSYMIVKMRQFLQANRDVLVYENYFNESDSFLASSLWNPVQNSRSGKAYRQLW